MSDPIVSQVLSEAVQKNDKEKLIELGFGNIDRRDIHLDAYGFTNWSLNATWTDTSAQTEFKLHTSPIKVNKLNFF